MSRAGSCVRDVPMGVVGPCDGESGLRAMLSSRPGRQLPSTTSEKCHYLADGSVTLRARHPTTASIIVKGN